MGRGWITGLALASIVLDGRGPARAAEPVPSGSIAQSVELLAETPSGKKLLQQAIAFWNLKTPEDLMGSLRPGGTSRTDAVLTRHYNPLTRSETRERTVVVYVKTQQSIEDIALDLAHELIHATTRPGWDPYDAKLTALNYIQNAIEGPGGEVAAVISECKVEGELLAEKRKFLSRCHDYAAKGGGVDTEKIKKDFYRVGRWYSSLMDQLGQKARALPLLSPELPRLYSSTGKAPYPAALFLEFNELSETACNNSRKRLETKREPASVLASSQVAEVQRFLMMRCGIGLR